MFRKNLGTFSPLISFLILITNLAFFQIGKSMYFLMPIYQKKRRRKLNFSLLDTLYVSVNGSAQPRKSTWHTILRLHYSSLKSCRLKFIPYIWLSNLPNTATKCTMQSRILTIYIQWTLESRRSWETSAKSSLLDHDWNQLGNRVGRVRGGGWCTDKKEYKIFLIYQEIQKRLVAKSYMTMASTYSIWLNICA